MAEAALDYDQLLDQPPLEIPAGGIANFITATTGSWADEDDIPRNGIAEVKKVANKLAEYGRHEDEYMVHAAESETVIPMAVFRENPRLKEKLFEQMRMMGIDPERYVVGNELNSINPVTGQPEFFLKKLWRGVKKVFKKVIHVVLPVVLNYMTGGALGLMGSAALGSGIITLTQGGSFGDALKSAAMGGAMAGMFKGIQGGIQGARSGQGFGAGFRGGLTEGLPSGVRGRMADRALAAEQAEALRVGELTPEIDTSVTPDLQVPGADVEIPLAGPQAPQSVAQGPPSTQNPNMMVTAPRDATTFEINRSRYPGGAEPSVQAGVFDSVQTGPAGLDPELVDHFDKLTPTAKASALDPELVDHFDKLTPKVGGRTVPTGAPSSSAAATGGVADIDTRRFGESIRDAFTPGDDKGMLSSLRQAFFPQEATWRDLAKARYPGVNPNTLNYSVRMDLLEEAKSMAPNMIRRFGPLLGTTMAIDKLTKPDEIEVDLNSPWGGPTGYELFQANPKKYSVQFQTPTYGRAHGGSIDAMQFPPRIGAISGPGTETSDDVPAMLSDGEFVMTAEAVRGAGNGNRQAGMNNMYNLMRNFERVA